MRFMRRMIASLRKWLLGEHPHNTFLSYNWHNVRHITRFLEAQSQSLKNGRYVIADIGGGQSPYFCYFGDLADEFICVDMSENLPLDDARGIRKVEGVAENIPLENESVDIVLCNQVLEHVIDPEKSCREIFRILRKGGIFLGSVPHVSPVHLEPYDFRRYTDLGVVQLIEGAGFGSIEVDRSGGVFSAAALMINMDVFLSKRDDKPQRFHPRAAFVLSPLVGLTNLSGYLLDRIVGDRKRTPANLCWVARKT